MGIKTAVSFFGCGFGLHIGRSIGVHGVRMPTSIAPGRDLMNNIVLYCSGVETKNIIYLTEFSTALSVNEVVEPQKPMTIRLENAEQSGWCRAPYERPAMPAGSSTM